MPRHRGPGARIALAANTPSGTYQYGFHRLLADLNGDRVVDLLDWNLMYLSYNSVAGDARYVYAYDLDRNGRIDRYDYAIWRLRQGLKV